MDDHRWISAYLEAAAAEQGAARNTLLAYGRDLKDFADHLARRGQSFATAPREAVEDYLMGLEAEGLSRATRARRLSAIRQMFRFAHEEGWRADHPAQRIKGPGARRSLPKTLQTEDVARLIEAARDLGKTPAEAARNLCLFELLYATGLRVSELVSLPRAAAMGDPRMILVRGKGDKERLVPLSPPARAAMADWLVHLKAMDEASARIGGRPAPPARHLFPTTSALGHLTRQQFHGLIKRAALAAGLDPARVSPHTIRHAFATHLLAGGADLRVIQTLLGHADLATTEIYTHVLEDQLKSLVLTRHPLARKS